MTQPGEERSGLGRDWLRVAWVLALGKAVYLGVLAGVLWLWGDLDEARFLGVMMNWPREGGPVFASHFATWDGAHYLFLSEVGYGPGVRSNAFYPLYPLLVRWASVFTGGSHLLAGLVLANLCSLAGWVIFHEVTRRRFGADTARWALALLVAFPGSLFFQFVYTEGLFFLLVMVLWMGLERQRYGWAWIAALLLPLTRAVGLFCLLPIAWHLVTRRPLGWMRRWGVERWDPPETSTAASGPVNPAGFLPYSLLLAPVAGWVFYLALMWRWTGDPFDGMAAQRYWGAHSIANLINVPKFVVALFSPSEWHAFRGSILDRGMFILLLYGLPLMWRLGKDQLVWAYVLGILPAMSGTFTSFTRFESIAFPLFIAWGAFLARRTGHWTRLLALAVSGGLHLWLLWRFVNFRWAG
jgi:hypothetical protein